MKKLLITTLLFVLLLVLLFLSITKLNTQNDVIISIIGTVLGGLLLSFIYFLLYEFLYRIPDFNGKWEFIEMTKNSTYNPYKDMEVKYLAILWNEGRNVYGSGERISEQEYGKSNKVYEAKERVNIEIQGHIKKRYFWHDEVIIHYIEEGKNRKTSTIHKLYVQSSTTINGSFFKTAANASGNSSWKKKEYDEN